MLKFTWDPEKQKSNRAKHGFSFEEASTCFYDPMHILISDPVSSEEDRSVLAGVSSKSRLLVAVHLEKTDVSIRLISARKTTRLERKHYEEVI